MLMAKGEPKRKKAKKDVFTVNLYYDGLFTSCPMIYFQGQCKVLTDTNFDEMTYVYLLEILKRLVPNGFEKVYYCKSGAKLTSIREIKSDQDIVDLLKVGYDNGFQIDMYVDHFGYDIMEMVEYDKNEELRKTKIKAELDSSDDDYHYSDDDLEDIENVDFHTKGDDSVVIKNITTQEPFLTKLCSARVLFKDHVEFGVNEETPQVDPYDNQIDPVYKVKKGVVYPAFDPDIPWDKMEPILGMRFETPHQLKMALANYGVAYGYQLWLFIGDEGNQASKTPVKKPVKKLVKKPLRNLLYASWMSREQSFQIKSLRSEHNCCRNYNLGSLVTYKWIVVQYFKEIIEDPFMPLRKMRDDIRQKFMIDVSVGQCKRAKQLALFDHEGGLIEHYAKLYQYMQAILDSNPGSTCTLDVVESDNGSVSFKRMYICFKGVKDGWLVGCRKGLIDAFNDWLPEAKHIKCTRHIYANFKKKYSGLQYQRLFWAAASYTLEQQFLQIMDQIKLLDANAYDYLIQRDPNSWSRAFFDMDRRCATFENGMSESFNRAILGLRMKPIITMLEEIRLYIMQRLVAMNKLAFSLEDTITPSIRKRMWELSGIPCVHAVAAYIHVGYDLDAGVSHWYSRESWFNAYQFSIKLVFGTNMWKRTNDCASRGGGRSGRGDGNDGSGSGSSVNDASGSGVNAGSANGVTDGSGNGGRGGGKAGGSGGRGSERGGGSGGRGGGRAGGSGKRGGGRAGRGSQRGGEYQLELDKQAFKECMEEQAREQAKINAEQEKLDKERREEHEWEEKNDYFNPANWQEKSMEEAPMNQQYHEVFIPSIHSQPTQQSGVWVVDTTVSVADVDEAPEQGKSPVVDKGKAKATVEDGPAPEQGKSPAVDKGKTKASVEDVPAPKKKRG
ncbi:hypothetical protein Tco_0103375 [Tanacetum coccineum]